MSQWIKFDFFSDSFINKQLSPSLISYHQLSPAITSYHQLSSAIISYHQLSPASKSPFRKCPPALFSPSHASTILRKEHDGETRATRMKPSFWKRKIPVYGWHPIWMDLWRNSGKPWKMTSGREWLISVTRKYGFSDSNAKNLITDTRCHTTMVLHIR